MMHGVQTYQGEKKDSFELALLFFSQDPEKYRGLMTHTFPINQFKDALGCVENKAKHKAIKVAFKYE
jgi:hypothetical protein